MAGGSEGRATVVVAAADDTVGEVLARIVELDGHEAIRIATDAPVVDAVTSSGATAVVLDRSTANVEELTAVRAASGEAATVRAVVISTGPANALLVEQAGADVVLTRPFAADDLRAALTPPTPPPTTPPTTPPNSL